MLVLARKKGESIVIQDHIHVTILEVDGETVKIGIEAPKEIEVYRKEIYSAVQEANKMSAHSSLDFSQLKTIKLKDKKGRGKP